jgi:hypothetical protein
MKIYTANRISTGNRLYPAEILIDDYTVTVKYPGIFSTNEHVMPFSKISSVKTHVPFFGFSKIVITALGFDTIIVNGFEKNDAEEIKCLIRKNIR